MTYPQLPDAEAALITFLTAHAVLAPLHGGRVSSELQSDLACLQVTALGGPQPWPWEAAPEFSISSWGPKEGTGSKAAASALDRAVRSAVFELLGQAITGGRVNSVAVRLSGLWSPADDTGRPRYRSDVALTVFP
ncbi:MAG TPA: hypothetical protein VHK64_04780 [Nocardioidaceae bacterium]|nr:hypothetical protein [Nocardioidaceae bacterium]